MNAAIFKAAGPALEVATKEQAQMLHPGNAVAVPLPSTSPLFSREGITHVIHVLGPNMNPQRPNCLHNDYITGCEVLRNAYTSLFQEFASVVKNQATSVVKNQAKFSEGSDENLLPNSSDYTKGVETKHSPNSDQKSKREDEHNCDRSKKCKGSQDEVEANIPDSRTGKKHTNDDKICGSMTKSWGSWAQGLYRIAMNPERHKDVVLETSDNVAVLNDLYPKVNLNIPLFLPFKCLSCIYQVWDLHLFSGKKASFGVDML